MPLPGETALIAAGVLAQQGHFHSIEVVIVVAALAAIIGDNVGYWLGRKGGRGAARSGRRIVRDAFERALPPAERFFERHGAKTVFIGRFVAFLRITSAWLAGISHMPWWRFFFWNALGGIVWATVVGVVAYKFGEAAADAINKYGLYGGDRRRRRACNRCSSCFGSGRSECSKTRETLSRSSSDTQRIDERRRFSTAYFASPGCPLHYHDGIRTSPIRRRLITWLGEQFSYAITVARKSVRTRAQRCA